MNPILQWRKQPSRTQHRILGLRLRWTDRSQRYRIERSPRMEIRSSSSCSMTAFGGP